MEKEKGKGTGHILQIWGQGLGGKRLNHHAVSHFIPKYIRSDTKDMQQDPICTFYFPRQHRGGSCKYINGVCQLWELDRRRRG